MTTNDRSHLVVRLPRRQEKMEYMGCPFISLHKIQSCFPTADVLIVSNTGSKVANSPTGCCVVCGS